MVRRRAYRMTYYAKSHRQTLPLDEGEAARDANADRAEYGDGHMMIASHGPQDNEVGGEQDLAEQRRVDANLEP